MRNKDVIFSSNSIIPESPKSLIATFPDKIAPLLEVKHPVYTSFVRKTINADKWQWATRISGEKVKILLTFVSAVNSFS